MEKINGRDSVSAGGGAGIIRIRIGLTGNPNSGKTTIFNEITGAHQKVGNWPGVTVEVKSGVARYKNYIFEIIDLPGSYSLSTQSKEERIAREYILEHRPDVIIQVIEGPNIERNLYLTTQLIDLGVPVVIALNMYDEIKARKIRIDIRKLSKLLGMPIIPTIGKRGKGIRRLLNAVIDTYGNGEYAQKPVRVDYGHEIEDHIAQLEETIKLTPALKNRYPVRWLALGLIEGDEFTAEKTHKASALHDGLFTEAIDIRRHLVEIFKSDPEEYITDRRYGFIGGALKESAKFPESKELSLTERIDSIVTNRILGIPILLLLMWLLFRATFGLGAYPEKWIETGVSAFGNFVTVALPDNPVKNLIVDGVIGGVGSVIVFLPNILILFLGIALLEDSGYMARAAFVTDKVMHALNLHGKSFIPLLMGFGCAVPAVMATRMLESRRDRILTMLIVPLMSCSARLPVYILIAGTFFPTRAGNIIFLLYIIGIIMALIAGRVLGSTLFRGQSSPFVMELPTYRWPTARSVVIHMWHRSRLFLKKMGGVILVGSVVLWFMGEYPKMNSEAKLSANQTIPPNIERIDHSHAPVSLENVNTESAENRASAGNHNRAALEFAFIGRIGHFIAPVVKPLGFNWEMGVSLLSGFVAKEVVVSSLGVLYSVGDESEHTLSDALKASNITPLTAFAFMIFTLLYTPCIATVTAIHRESGSYRWMFLSIFYQLAVAWMAAFIIYQGGRIFGLG